MSAHAGRIDLLDQDETWLDSRGVVHQVRFMPQPYQENLLRALRREVDDLYVAAGGVSGSALALHWLERRPLVARLTRLAEEYRHTRTGGRIYGLFDNGDYGLRYVGQTYGYAGPPVRRFRQHVTSALKGGSSPVHAWMRKMAKEYGSLPVPIVIERVVDAAELDAREKHWIEFRREEGDELFNRKTKERSPA